MHVALRRTRGRRNRGARRAGERQSRREHGGHGAHGVHPVKGAFGGVLPPLRRALLAAGSDVAVHDQPPDIDIGKGLGNKERRNKRDETERGGSCYWRQKKIIRGLPDQRTRSNHLKEAALVAPKSTRHSCVTNQLELNSTGLDGNQQSTRSAVVRQAKEECSSGVGTS